MINEYVDGKRLFNFPTLELVSISQRLGFAGLDLIKLAEAHDEGDGHRLLLLDVARQLAHIIEDIHEEELRRDFSGVVNGLGDVQLELEKVAKK